MNQQFGSRFLSRIQSSSKFGVHSSHAFDERARNCQLQQLKLLHFMCRKPYHTCVGLPSLSFSFDVDAVGPADRLSPSLLMAPVAPPPSFPGRQPPSFLPLHFPSPEHYCTILVVTVSA